MNSRSPREADIAGWRLYYDDHSTVDSNQSAPEDTPGPGLICIVQPDEEVGRMVLSGDPYFWWDGQWWSGDLFGLYDYLMRPGFKVVRFGRTVSNREFREIMDRAINDPDFAPKSGWRNGERR